MRKFNSFIVLMLVISLVICMILLVSCTNSTSSNEQTNAQGDKVSEEEKKGEQKEEDFDPFGKYDPPIEVTTVRIVDDTYKYEEGESLENNIWTRTIEEELGIKIKNLWVVSGAQQGEQKMNVSIASGDIPDIIPVNLVQLAQLVNADMIMDLTEIYDKYAAPFTKEIMTQEGNVYFDACTFNGRLMAIPNTGSSMDGAPLLWIRADWLAKLGLEPPKTMNDVLHIIEAFTKQDPDGNGKDDTFGIAINKDLFGGYAGLEGFFNGYHAYPRCWIEDESGKLVYGSIQPEVKEALRMLNHLYKTGCIDKEFGVKDAGKVAESAASGKVGLHYGQMWNPIWPLQASYDNDPNADWTAYPIVSVDGDVARPQVSLALGTCYAVKKDAKYPEAVVKLVNLFIEKGWGETADPGAYFNTKEGIEKFKYAPVQAWPARKNLDAHLHIKEVLDGGDKGKLNAEELDYYEKIMKYKEGEGRFWCLDKVFGKAGSFAVINKYVNEDILMMNKFYGAPTPTQVEKSSTLSKMELEVFTKIILGESPIEEFDKFVDEWRKLGGDDITKEVNDWYSSR